MAKSFLEASWQLTFACTANNNDRGNGSQKDVRDALFELLRCSEDARTPDGKKVGPFETADELSDFLDNCPDREIDHLLIREFADGEARAVPINKRGSVHSYDGKTISAESYLETYAPGELRSAGAPRKPGTWDKIMDFVRGIFGGRDPAVKAYEDYQARCTAYLNDRGFGKNETPKITADDVKIEAPENTRIYEDKYFTENLDPNESLDFEDADREKNKVRDILRPENFGYNPGKEMSDKMYANMHGIVDGDMPEELANTRLGKDFEAYRHFAQTIYDLADEKKMRDAIVMMNKSGALGKIYQSYKRDYENGEELEIGKMMQKALFDNKKDDLVKTINNEKVAGLTHALPGRD